MSTTIPNISNIEENESKDNTNVVMVIVILILGLLVVLIAGVVLLNIKHKPINPNPYLHNNNSIAFDNPAYDINTNENSNTSENSNISENYNNDNKTVLDITNRDYLYQDVPGQPVEYENVEPPSSYYPDAEYLDILENKPASETDL